VSPECQRIAALKACAILDTAAHPAFDCLTRAAALAFDAPIALVSLVDTDRQWFKSVLGVDLRETPRNVSFCTHTIEGFEPMVVPDAMRDLRFFANPLVTGSPHVRFYAGAPLIDCDGYALGTLCILDTVPRQLDGRQLRLLGHFADAVMHAVTAHRQSLDIKDLHRRLHQQDVSPGQPDRHRLRA